MAHGGLRCLEYCEFRLVREALVEREVLLAAPPHLIRPMRLVLPHSPEQRPARLVRLGLFLYDSLGGRKHLPGTRTLDLRTAPEGKAVKPEFRKGFEYSDCCVYDVAALLVAEQWAATAEDILHRRTKHGLRLTAAAADAFAAWLTAHVATTHAAR